MTQDLAHREGGAVANRAPATPAQALATRIDQDDFRTQIQKALPDGVTVDRFIRATITALFDKPEIAEKCDHGTIIQAAIKCAQWGLLPDGREAAIVPFGNTATFMPMIGGFRKIAGEHGWSIETHAVYSSDDFDYELGLDPTVRHRPARTGADRGELVAAYAICRHRDGRRLVEVMERDEVMRAKAVSRQQRGDLEQVGGSRLGEDRRPSRVREAAARREGERAHPRDAHGSPARQRHAGRRRGSPLRAAGGRAGA